METASSFFKKTEAGYSLADMIWAIQDAWSERCRILLEGAPTEEIYCTERFLIRFLEVATANQEEEKGVESVLLDGQLVSVPSKSPNGDVNPEELQQWKNFLAKTIPSTMSVEWLFYDTRRSRTRKYIRHNQDHWLLAENFDSELLEKFKKEPWKYIGTCFKVADKLSVDVTPSFLQMYEKAQQLLWPMIKEVHDGKGN